jgi:hypothetical protein
MTRKLYLIEKTLLKTRVGIDIDTNVISISFVLKNGKFTL